MAMSWQKGSLITSTVALTQRWSTEHVWCVTAGPGLGHQNGQDQDLPPALLALPLVLGGQMRKACQETKEETHRTGPHQTGVCVVGEGRDIMGLLGRSDVS